MFSRPFQRFARSTRLTSALLGLWLALGSALLAGCSLSLPGSGATATPASGSQLSPAWTSVLKQIGPNGAVSLATALQAYTLVFGPLPGVQTPAGGSGLIPSGTLAERMVLRHYHDLTAAQQTAVLQRLGYTAPASAEVAPRVAPLAAMAQAQARPLAPPRVAPAAPTPTPPADGAGTGAYRTMLNEFIPKVNAFLSFTLTLPEVLSFEPALKGKNVLAYASPVDGLGGPTGLPVLCRIRVSPDVDTFGIEVERFIIAHELMHCYQAEIQGPLSVHVASPDWLIEGSAEWAGAVVSGATSANSSLQITWMGYLEQPALPLFERAYSALGFYAVLDEAGISPWSVLIAMLKSQSKGANNVAAYQAATTSAPQAVLDTWASSYERDSALGLFWDLTGPGIIASSAYKSAIQQVTLVSGGQPLAVKAAAYTVSDAHITSHADVLHVNIAGTSRLIDSAHVERVTSANGDYCTKSGGCACPSGSAYQGPALPQLTGLVHLAVTGGPSGASGTVSGTTLQDFCSHSAHTTVGPALCSLLTPEQATQAIHESVTTVGGTLVKPIVGLSDLVDCFYSDSTGHPHAFILIGDGAQAQTSFASLKQQIGPASSIGIVNVSGLGDAAFEAAPTGAQAKEVVYTLFVLKGDLVLEFATDLPQAAAGFNADRQLALDLLPKV